MIVVHVVQVVQNICMLQNEHNFKILSAMQHTWAVSEPLCVFIMYGLRSTSGITP